MKLLLLFKNVWKFKRDLQNKRKSSVLKRVRIQREKQNKKNRNKNKRRKKRKAGDIEIQMGTYIRINIIKKMKKSKPRRKERERRYIELNTHCYDYNFIRNELAFVYCCLFIILVILSTIILKTFNRKLEAIVNVILNRYTILN